MNVTLSIFDIIVCLICLILVNAVVSYVYGFCRAAWNDMKPSCKGKHLDNYAALFGLKRKHMESDRRLRKRIIKVIKSR